MQINSLNSVNFGNLHIKQNATNKAVLEKCLKRNPEAIKETLDEIDRESGEKDVYMYTGMCDGNNIDVMLADDNMNILAARRIGLGNPDHFKIAADRFVFQFTNAICKPREFKSSENEEVNNILNKYI